MYMLRNLANCTSFFTARPPAFDYIRDTPSSTRIVELDPRRNYVTARAAAT